jgi:hypothetical protein
MKQITRSLLGFVGVAAVAGGIGAYAWWQMHQDAGPKGTADQMPLLTVPPDALASIEIKDPGSHLVLHKEERGWRLKKPFDAPADREAIEKWLSTLANLKPRLVFDNEGDRKPPDLQQAGLAAPALTITVTEGGNEKAALILSVGSRSSFSKDFYAQSQAKGASPRVVTIPALERATLDVSPTDLRQKRMLNALAPEVARLRVIPSTPTDEAIEFELEQLPANATGQNEYNLVFPITGPADRGVARRVFLGVLSSLGSGFVATGADGGLPPDLQKPAWTLQAFVRPAKSPDGPTTKRTLLVGALHEKSPDNPSPWVWAMEEGDTWAYKVHGDLVLVLNISLETLKDKRLFRFPRESIRRVDMKLKELGRVTLELEEAGKWVMLSPQPGVARADAMQVLLLTFANLAGSAIVAEGDAASEKAILDLTGLAGTAQYVSFFDADKKKLGTLLIGDAEGENTYVMAEANKVIYKIATTQLRALPTSLDTLIEAEEKTE